MAPLWRHPGERAWLDAHEAAYQARRAEDPIPPQLIRAAMARHWIPEFVTTVPTGDREPEFAGELAGIRSMSDEAATIPRAIRAFTPRLLNQSQ